MKAARLNADLVVRKGDPARCRGGGAKVVRLQEVTKRPAATPQASVPAAPPPASAFIFPCGWTRRRTAA